MQNSVPLIGKFSAASDLSWPFNVRPHRGSMNPLAVGASFLALGLLLMATAFDLTHTAVMLCRRLLRHWTWWPRGKWPLKSTRLDRSLAKILAAVWLLVPLILAIAVGTTFLLPNSDLLLKVAGGKVPEAWAILTVVWLFSAIAVGFGWGFRDGFRDALPLASASRMERSSPPPAAKENALLPDSSAKRKNLALMAVASFLLGSAIVLVIWYLLVIQGIPPAAGVIATLIAMGQLGVAYLLYTVNRSQVAIARRQMEIQHEESVRSGAVVQAAQVPTEYLGFGTVAQIIGIEIWNAGRQATQIREAWFQWDDDYFNRPKTRFLWFEGGPHKGAHMALETRLLEPGKLWQIKLLLDPLQTIMGQRNPKLVIVPALGNRVEVTISDPSSLTGFAKF